LTNITCMAFKYYILQITIRKTKQVASPGRTLAEGIFPNSIVSSGFLTSIRTSCSVIARSIISIGTTGTSEQEQSKLTMPFNSIYWWHKLDKQGVFCMYGIQWHLSTNSIRRLTGRKIVSRGFSWLVARHKSTIMSCYYYTMPFIQNYTLYSCQTWLK